MKNKNIEIENPTQMAKFICKYHQALKMTDLQIHTLRENTSLLSKWEQRSVNSMAVLEAIVSSAWMVSVPKFLRIPCPFLFWSFRVKVRFCLVTICREERKNEYTQLHNSAKYTTTNSL